MKIPDLSKRFCNQCLWQEDAPQFLSVCPDSKDGKHRLRPKYLWAGVVLSTFFDVRSEDTAIRLFGEACADNYILARRFSPEEIAALQHGARLELRITK